MTTTIQSLTKQIKSADADGKRVYIESGRGEDHDTGWVYIDDGGKLIASWDSGVKTPFEPDSSTTIVAVR